MPTKDFKCDSRTWDDLLKCQRTLKARSKDLMSPHLETQKS